MTHQGSNELKLCVAGNSRQALEYISVEFGMTFRRVMYDALCLYVFLEQQKRKSMSVWSDTVPPQLSFCSGSAANYSDKAGIMWRVLEKRIRSMPVAFQMVRLSHLPDEVVREIHGEIGERLQLHPIPEIRRMLAHIFYFYIEYRSGGSVKAFVEGFDNEPHLVDVCEHIGISDLLEVS